MSGTRYLARIGDRSLFPDLEPKVFLAHAAVSAPSIAVRRAVDACLGDYARLGTAAIGRSLALRERVRGALASLLGARPEELGLVQSTSAAVTAVALGVPWKRGDRVVCFEGEFPANVAPWQRAAEMYELDVRFVPMKPFARDHAEGLEMLGAALADGARLVATSAVHFATGLRFPIAEMAALCHAHGALLFVDAIQSVGVVPGALAATGADFVAGGAHKWLMGIEGVGYLYASEARASELRPAVSGWLGLERPVAFLTDGPGHLDASRAVRRDVRFVESGSASMVGLAALEASLALLAQIGVEDVYAHVSAYLDRLEEELVELGLHSVRSPAAAARSGIVSVVPPEGRSVVALRDALARRGVAVTIPDGLLRFAPHWPNALDEVKVVVAAVGAALRE